MPAYRYGVLGAGRQGTAAAYDLVARGEAASVILADADAGRAAAAAERVNRPTGGGAARAGLELRGDVHEGGPHQRVRRRVYVDRGRPARRDPLPGPRARGADRLRA